MALACLPLKKLKIWRLLAYAAAEKKKQLKYDACLLYF